MSTADETALTGARLFGVDVARELGGRASRNWLVRRHDEDLVLRLDSDPFSLGRDRLGEAIDWRARARARASEVGAPVPVDVDPPVWSQGWWSLETFLPGEPRPLSPAEHAAVVADWHELAIDTDALGPQPYRFRPLDALTDADADALVARVAKGDDRSWLTRRLDQARALAATIDWAASPTRLVHGDLATHNLLWRDGGLSGVVDVELATVDRRVTDLINVWRCRYDDVVLAYDAISPLTEHEWRMLLVDWWASMVGLALIHLRRGERPGQWELDGLRRSSPLAVSLERQLG